MFREMRRSKQQLASEEALDVLERGKWGTLAVLGDGGYPYAVPLNYVFFDDCIYFHCALDGHKLDAIEACDKVSFCVVDKDDVVPAEYTSYYVSVVAFGRAHVVEDEQEKMSSLLRLGNKYNPGHVADTDAEAQRGGGRMHMVRIDIDHISGKQARELVRGGAA